MAGRYAQALWTDSSNLVLYVTAAAKTNRQHVVQAPGAKPGKGMNVSQAKRIQTAAKTLMNGVNKATLLSLATRNGLKQYRAIVPAKANAKSFHTIAEGAFVPFSPTPWGLSVTDDLTGANGVGIVGSGATPTVTISVPPGMTGLRYFVSETAYGVLADDCITEGAVEGDNFQVFLRFGDKAGGARVVVVDADGHFVRSRLYFNRGYTPAQPPMATVTRAYDGNYKFNGYSWAPSMGHTPVSGTFSVHNGYVSDSTGNFTGYIYDGGSAGGVFTGTLKNSGAGVLPLNATGNFYRDGSAVIKIGDSTVGMDLNGKKL